MSILDTLIPDVAANLRRTEWRTFNEQLPDLLRAHQHAAWLAVAARSEAKEALAGAPVALFPVGGPIPVAGASESDVEHALGMMKQDAAAHGQQLESIWCRRDGAGKNRHGNSWKGTSRSRLIGTSASGCGAGRLVRRTASATQTPKPTRA